MLDRSYKKDPYTLVMLTLDAHSIGSVERIKSRFSKIYPELEIIVHAAASWEEDPDPTGQGTILRPNRWRP